MCEHDAEKPSEITRRGALAAGAGIALAGLTGTEAAEAKPPKLPKPKVAQTGWRYCTKCRALHYDPAAKKTGVCPAGGKHNPRKDLDVVIYRSDSPTSTETPDWFRCRKCAALFSEYKVKPCAKGGTHAREGSEFVLWYGSGIARATDDAWDRCTKCGALYNLAGGATGVCAAGGGHSPEGGGTYKLVAIY